MSGIYLVQLDKNLLSLDGYKRKRYFEKEVKASRERLATQYVSGIFVVNFLNDSGRMEIQRGSNCYKLLLDGSQQKEFRVGDTVKAVISKKMYYVYWEIEYVDYIKH